MVISQLSGLAMPAKWAPLDDGTDVNGPGLGLASELDAVAGLDAAGVDGGRPLEGLPGVAVMRRTSNCCSECLRRRLLLERLRAWTGL